MASVSVKQENTLKFYHGMFSDISDQEEVRHHKTSQCKRGRLNEIRDMTDFYVSALQLA